MDGEQPKIVIAQRAESDRIKFDEQSIFLASDVHSAPPVRTMNTVKVGAIDQMDVPKGWVSEDSSFATTGRIVSFHPQNEPDVSLSSKYRGHRLSPDSEKAFKDLLAQPQSPAGLERTLQDGPMKEVLDNLGDKNDFQIRFARTQEINGRRALVVEGHFNEDNFDCRKIFVDTDGRGAIQEIKYEAPTAQFMRYWPQASKALDSIHWKK